MGDNSTSSTSRPLTAAERNELYATGMGNMNAHVTKAMNTGTDEAETFDPGAAKQLANGDYDALERSIVDSRMAPLSRAMALERDRSDADVAKRGLFSSGIGVRAQGDVTERFAPTIAQAGADAATQRYNLQASDLNNANQYNVGRATLMNTVAGQRKTDQRNNAWRPAEYMQGMWNGTGGVVSQGSGGGWSI